MRDIKYKIYDKKLKESHIVELQELCEDDYWYDGKTEIWSVLYDCNNKQERFTALQYTGLKDKNEVEIYEGDILQNVYDDDVGIIEWSEEDAMFVLTIDNLETNFSNERSKHWEVIGNIYDNPELLKGE